jgi:arginine N-succinyltransferase
MNTSIARDTVTVVPWLDSDTPALSGWINHLGQPLSATPGEGEQGWLVRNSQGRNLAAVRWRLRSGMDAPRFSFHVGCMVHASRELGLFQTHNTLQLGNDHTGQAELLDLAHAPGDPEPQRTLSQALQMALAEFSMAGAASVAGSPPQWLIVELPGQVDAQGSSPFWRALGAQFFQGDPAQARHELGERWNGQLAALMPRQTVYLSLMPLSARVASGRHAESAKAAHEALRRNGFVFSQHVRIDDGGPILMRELGVA